jgi:hypothetical protein
VTDFERLQALVVPHLSPAALGLMKLADTLDKVQAAAAKTNTEPTEAQKESGRYAKGKVAWNGLTLVVETPKGATRSGKSKDGTEWSIKLKDHYGYFASKESGADGDEVDFFLSEAHPDSEIVFVVNQVGKDGTFDEHKCVLGCITESEARDTYLRNYSTGWTGLGSIKPMTLPDFKKWLDTEPEKAAHAKQAAETEEEFWKRNAASAERTKDSKLGHVRDGYIPCGGCGFRYHEMPETEVCYKCGGKLGVRLRSMKRVSKTAADDFKPDLTPEQLKALGVYERMYDKPETRPASMPDWPKHWLSGHDPKGWLQWYENYTGGRRLPEEDERQMKRWKSFKARHAAQFKLNPTPRRAFAFQHWAVDPYSLIPTEQHEKLKTLMDAHQDKVIKKVERTKTAADFQKVLFESPPELLLVKRAVDDGHTFTICVDLDGTLAEKEEPFNEKTIGDPRESAVEWVRLFHEAGARIIIFTVRGDEKLVRSWLEKNDVPFDFINENPDQPPNSSGKVFADVYWDDRAFNADDPDEHGPEILRRVKAHGGEEAEHEEPGHVVTISKQTVITISAPSLLEFMEAEDDNEEGTDD